VSTSFTVAARHDPIPPQWRQATFEIVMARPAAVVHMQRRLAAGNGDLPDRHAHALRPLDVDLA
jgi:hypothetical protein